MNRTAFVSASLVVTAGLLVVGCKDKNPIGPDPDRFATLSFTPAFESPHASTVTVDQGRLRVTRVSSGAEVLDTSFAVTSAIFTTTTPVEVEVPFSGTSEEFEGTLTLSGAGTDVFASDPVRTTGSAAAAAPVTVTLRYIGPGSQATGVAFSDSQPVVFFGNMVVLQASGTDANGPNPLIPVVFGTLDPTTATVADPSTGTIEAGTQRGLVGITATLLTGQADTVMLLVQPPPSEAGVTVGTGQSAEVMTALNPITLQVLGADSVGVSGALVTFTGEGTFAPESVVTDSLGLATTVWTLGTVAGTQTGTATVAETAAFTAPGAAGLRVEITTTFTAMAVAAAPARLSFGQEPSDANAGAPVTPQVLVLDAHGNTVLADSSTSVTFGILAGTGQGGAALLGINPVTALSGLVDAADLAVDLAGADYRLTATATGMTPDTSATFSIAVGALASVTLSPALDTLVAIGDSVALTPTAEDANGNPVTGVVYTWSSSDSSVVIPNASGHAVAQGNGSATVTATSGGVSGSATVVVGQVATSVVIAPTAATLTSLGDTTRFTASYADANGNAVTGLATTWSSEDGAVAGISGTGLVTANGNGMTSVIATSGALTDTAAVTVGQVATALVFSVQPANAVAGDTIPMQVEARDALGSVVTGFTGNVTLGFVDNPGGATLGGTATVAAALGVADFTDISLDAVGVGYTLEASSGALATDTTSQFDIMAGNVASIALAPTIDTVTAIGDSVQFTPSATDGSGNPLTGVAYTWSSSDSSVAIPNATGHAVAQGPGTATITAASGGVSGNATVVVTPLVATVDITPDSISLFSLNDTTTFAAALLDANGNPVSGSAPTWGVTDSSVASIDASGLVTALANGVIDVIASAGGVADTAILEVFQTATQVVFTTQPVTSAAGDTIPMQAQVLDAGGTLVTGFNNNVSLAFDANPGGATLTGATTVAAAGGVADFLDIYLDVVGAGYTLVASAFAAADTSVAFNITPGTASALVFTQEPVTSAAGAVIPMQVEARDGQGNVDTNFSANVTLAIGNNPGGATLGGTVTVAAVAGVADFTDNFLDLVGTGYTLTATSGGLNTTSAAFDINSAAATSLVFTTEPVTSVAGDTIPMQIEARDGQGNRDVSFTGTVTLTFANNPTGASLSGNVAVAAVAGVVDYTDIFLDLVGNGYTLTATAGGLNATSTAFNITPGAATGLVFTTEPVTSAASDTIPMRIEARDGQGNVDTNFTDMVTLTFANNPTGASLSGNVAVAAVAGVVDYTDIFLDLVGNGYTLTATAGGLNATSAAFNITPGAATGLVFTTEPVTSAAGDTIPMQIEARDGQGNVDTNFTDMVTLTFANNPTGATLSGNVAVAAVAGVVDYTDIFLDLVGNGYTLTATAGGINTTSAAFNIAPGAAAALVFSTEPVNSAAGDTIPMQVQALDGQGNLVTGFTGTVDLAFDANPGSANLNGTVSIVAAAGVADFADIYLDSADVGYTLEASSGVLTPATSAAFDIAPDTLATITLSPTADTIRTVGDSVLYTPTGRDAFGNTITGLVYTWGTLDSAVAEPDANGLGYAVAAGNGSTTITASSGNHSGNASVVVQAAIVQWLGTAGGLWSNPANWSTGALPTANDTVVIDTSGTYTVTLDVDATVAQLVVGGQAGAQQLDVASPNTLTVTDTASVAAGDILHQSGDVSLGGPLTVGGTYNWNAGTKSGTGTTDVLTGGTLAIDSSALKTLDGHTLMTTGTGAITLAGTGNLQADNSPTITNGGTLDIQSDADLVQGNSSGTIANGGTLQKSAGAATASVGWTVNNTNQVTAQAATGTLSLDDGGTHTGAFTADGILNFGGGTHTIGGAVAGTGTFSTTTGSVTLSNSYNVTTTDLSGGTLAFNTPAASVISALSHSGGTLTGTATVQLTGASTWSAGDWTGSGSTDVTGTGSLTVSSTTARTLDTRTVNNSGGVTVTDATTITVDNGAFINNLAGGTFDAQAPATITPTVALDGGFTNAGMFTRTTAGGAFTLDVPFTSSDTVDVQIGTFRMTGGDGGTPNTGVFLVNGDTLAFDGGNTVTYTVQDSVVGTGTVTVFTPGTDLFVNGHFDVGKTVVSQGVLQINTTTDTAVTDTLFALSGAVIQGVGVLAVADTGLWDGGTWWQGTTYIMPGAHLTIGTRATKSLNSGRTLDVAGTVTFPAGGGGDLVFNSNSVLNIQTTGTFDLQGNRSMASSGSSGSANVQNAGTVMKTTVAGTSAIQIPLNNAATGVVNVPEGTLQLTSDLDHPSGALVQGSATLDLASATISSFEGDITPGTAGTVDTLTIDRTAGTLTLGGASELHVDIASTTSSDQLAVTGTIDVTSGTVNIDATGAGLIGGEIFVIVTATTVTGTPAIGTVSGHAGGFLITNVGGNTIVITAQ